MAKQSGPVGHPELVGGAQTTLHLHPGGNGSVVKAGTITTDGAGQASVVFNTAFPDTDYAIALCGYRVETIIATWLNRTISGFDVRTEEDKGQTYGNVEVLWVATPYSNP